MIDLDPDRFHSLCRRLIERLGLEIEESEIDPGGEMILVARSRSELIGGEYLVVVHHVHRGGDPVTKDKVFKLLDAVRAQGALKGLYMTNSFFDFQEDARPEGPPAQLIDVEKLADLLRGNDLL
jgi:hypothetical protein